MLLEWALRYIKLGWPVIPLRGKLPLTKNGSHDASLNESQVRDWWKKWPNANIGITTGHRFFVVDVDIRGGGEDTWDMLRAQYAAYPPTIEQITGTGGRHLLFQLPTDFVVKNSAGTKLGPGVDVRGQGGYIVAAPSIHPETKRAYDWDGIEEIENQTIAPAPVWLLRLIQDSEKRPEPQRLSEKIAEGGRNDVLFKLASRLRRIAFSEEEIFASLAVVNLQRCQPPLPPDELRTIAKSAARYDPDARANVFRVGGVGAQAPESTEASLSQADVEAAVADAIAKNDPKAIAGLVEAIAGLKTAAQAVILAKLEIHFQDQFPKRAFERALRELKQEQKLIVMPGGGSAPPPAPKDSVDDGDGPDLLPYPLTDSGNGERTIKMFGQDMRYCVEMQKWLVWDGRRWAVDDRNAASQKAKRVARRLYEQALESTTTEKWARTSESQASITAALKRAATETWVTQDPDTGKEVRQPIPISASELDQHPYLLNCLNGVVDLRVGELLPHDRRFLITKMCNFNYDPKAECPRFLKFLYWAMGQNPEAEVTERTVRMVTFMQRAMGYSLTADVSEKVAFVFYGPKGNNGKTTLLTTFRMLLGEYSAQISIDTLMTQRGSTDAALRADLADLRGARFVTTSEVEKEHRMSEGKLKYITAGMGNIKSCRKYENPIEFAATHKLFMDCNYRPNVRGTDDAIWNRLKAIHFDVSMSKDDPEFDALLLEKLLAEGSGILRWAVEGAKAWQTERLGNPPEIADANREWREHDDPLKEFLEDCCELPTANDSAEEIKKFFWVKSSELGAAYESWCKKNRERYPLGGVQFGERIESKGFKRSRSRRDDGDKQMRTIEGIKLREDVKLALGSERSSWAKDLVE